MTTPSIPPVVRVLFGDPHAPNLKREIVMASNVDKEGAWESFGGRSNVHYMVFGIQARDMLVDLGIPSSNVHMVGRKSSYAPEGESFWWNKSRLVRESFGLLSTRHILFVDLDVAVIRRPTAHLFADMWNRCEVNNVDFLAPVVFMKTAHKRVSTFDRPAEDPEKHVMIASMVFYCRSSKMYDEVLNLYPVVRSIRRQQLAKAIAEGDKLVEVRHGFLHQGFDDESVITHWVDRKYGFITGPKLREMFDHEAFGNVFRHKCLRAVKSKLREVFSIKP